MKGLILARGGDAVASYPLGAQPGAWLRDGQPLLYVPVAMSSAAPSYAACRAWITSVFAPLSIAEILMWTDLGGKTRDDLRHVGVVYIGRTTFRLLPLLPASGVDHALATYIAEGGLVYGGSAGALIRGADIMTAAPADPTMVGLQDTRGA